MTHRLLSLPMIGLFAIAALLFSVSVVAAQEVTPSVTVSDQAVPEAAAGAEAMVMVDSVTAAEDGWIVIHRDNNGAPGEVIGWSQVQQGSNENVSVTLEGDVAAGDSFWAMLHIDAGTMGTYEFPGPDAPVTQDGAPVQDQFALTEAAGGATQAQPTTQATTQATTQPTTEATTQATTQATTTTGGTASQPSTLPQTSGEQDGLAGVLALLAAVLFVVGAIVLFRTRRRV